MKRLLPRAGHGGRGGIINVIKAAVIAAVVVSELSAPRHAAAYSVLAHEANIDAL